MTFFNNRLADIFRGKLRPSSCLSEWIKRQPDIKFFVKDPYRESEFGIDSDRISKLVVWTGWPRDTGRRRSIVFNYNGSWELKPKFFEFRKRFALWLIVKAFSKEIRDE